jgi:hypothetical protein
MMRIPRTPLETHDRNDGRCGDDFQDAPTRQGSPQSILRPSSLKIAPPFRQVLLRHQSVLWARTKSVTPPTPPTWQKAPTNPSAQRNFIMAIKVEHLKDKWRGSYSALQ